MVGTGDENKMKMFIVENKGEFYARRNVQRIIFH